MGFTPKSGLIVLSSAADELSEGSASQRELVTVDDAFSPPSDAGSCAADDDEVEASMRRKRLEELARSQENSIQWFRQKAQDLVNEEQAELDAAAQHLEEAKVALQVQARGGTHEAMYQKSLIVSNFLDDRQVRSSRFASNCQELVEANERNARRVVADLEAQDRRAAERLRERREMQRAKSFKESQRRTEQQKACAELRREHERVYDNFYAQYVAAQAGAGDGEAAGAHSQPAKHQRPSSQGSSRRSASGSFVGHPSPQRPASQGSSRASRNPDVVFAKDPIYKDIKKSHTLYMQELEKMSTSVAQNERRTEAYYRKLLGPDWRRLKITSPEDDGKGSRKASRTRRRASTAPGRGDQDKASLAKAARMLKLGLIKPKATAEADDAEALSPTGESTPGLGERRPSSAPDSTWDQRNAAAEQVRDQIQGRKEERWSQIEQSIGQSKLRRSTSQAALKESASVRLEDWAAKSRTCFERKAADSVTSDARLQGKLQGFQERWGQARQEQDALRGRSVADRADNLRNIRAKEQSRLQEQAERIAARMNQKEETANELIKQRLEDYGAKATGDHKEKAKQFHSQKQAEEANFRQKAISECQVNDARTAEALLKKKRSTLDNLRAKRKPKQDNPMPTASNFVASHDAPEPLEDLSSIAANDTSALAATALSPQTAPQLDELLPRVMKRASLTKSPTPSVGLASPASAIGLLSLDGLPERRRVPEAVDDLQSSSARSNSQLEHAGGEDFLEELESRSVRWLQDMRRKSSFV